MIRLSNDMVKDEKLFWKHEYFRSCRETDAVVFIMQGGVHRLILFMIALSPLQGNFICSCQLFFGWSTQVTLALGSWWIKTRNISNLRQKMLPWVSILMWPCMVNTYMCFIVISDILLTMSSDFSTTRMTSDQFQLICEALGRSSPWLVW